MVAKNVETLLRDHVNLEVECLDRTYLNGYIRRFQTPGGLAYFVKQDLEMPVVSTTAVAPLSRQFVNNIERYARKENVEILKFKKGERETGKPATGNS